MSQVIDFSKEELDKLAKLTALYREAKALVLYSEEIDESASSNVQVFKEFRDAFDHLMRVFNNKFNDEVQPDNYAAANIDKAVGHVYRASFDALEGASIAIRRRIIEFTRYPIAVLSNVFPDYWKWKACIDELEEKFIEYRAKKDIADLSAMEELFDSYVRDLRQLQTIYSEIRDKGKVIQECYKKYRKENRRSGTFFIITSIVIAALFFLLGQLIEIPRL